MNEARLGFLGRNKNMGVLLFSMYMDVAPSSFLLLGSGCIPPRSSVVSLYRERHRRGERGSGCLLLQYAEKEREREKRV